MLKIEQDRVKYAKTHADMEVYIICVYFIKIIFLI